MTEAEKSADRWAIETTLEIEQMSSEEMRRFSHRYSSFLKGARMLLEKVKEMSREELVTYDNVMNKPMRIIFLKDIEELYNQLR